MRIKYDIPRHLVLSGQPPIPKGAIFLGMELHHSNNEQMTIEVDLPNVLSDYVDHPLFRPTYAYDRFKRQLVFSRYSPKFAMKLVHRDLYYVCQ